MEVILTLVGVAVWMLMEHPVIFWSIVSFFGVLIVIGIVIAIKFPNLVGKHKTNTNPTHFEKDKLPIFEVPKKHKGKCDGDCANCPPHYGYRYGRWYYGHDHVEGCEFGGNRCGGGRD